MRTRLAALLLLVLWASATAAEQKIAAPCTPGISFWSLLGALDVGYADGRLRINKLYAVCLPEPKTPSDSNYAYSPESGGKLTTVVKTAQDEVVNTFVWRAENISGLWELSEYKVLGGVVKQLGAGNYTLEFLADGTLFARFGFSVATAASDDPYQPAGIRYFIDGPWSEYANIFYQRNDPQSAVRFTTWVQDRITQPKEKLVPYEVQLVRVRDNKVMGRDKGELHADQQWKPLEVYFHAGDGDATPEVKAGDLLSDDGAYRVRFDINGKPYGTYAFSVSAGKIQLQGRQLDTTEPASRIVDYLYGGRYRSWWIPRSAGDAKISR
jgi:hypothetical protein